MILFHLAKDQGGSCFSEIRKFQFVLISANTDGRVAKKEMALTRC